MPDIKSKPLPVAGLVIRQSMRKVLIGLAFLLALLFISLGTIWLWWTDTEIPIPGGPYRVDFNRALGSMFAAALAGVVTPMIALLLFIQERLILAADRLQLVHGRGSGSVAIQVPYKNIAAAQIVDEEGVKSLRIRLKDIDAADTFAAGASFKEREDEAWHYALPDTFQTSLAEVARLLDERLREAGAPGVNP